MYDDSDEEPFHDVAAEDGTVEGGHFTWELTVIVGSPNAGMKQLVQRATATGMIIASMSGLGALSCSRPSTARAMSLDPQYHNATT